MKWWNGAAARRMPSISPICPAVIGGSPVVQAWSSAGCMTKKVRNSASPISTMLGGVLWVPSALRSSDSTMTMRVKAVTITSRLGASDSTVTSAVSWTIRLVAPAWPAAPRSMLTDCACAAAGASTPGAGSSTPARRQFMCLAPARKTRRATTGDDCGSQPTTRSCAPPVSSTDVACPAPHHQQSPARVQRDGILHRQDPPAGRTWREAGQPRGACPGPNQRQHHDECGNGGRQRTETKEHGAAFCRADRNGVSLAAAAASPAHRSARRSPRAAPAAPVAAARPSSGGRSSVRAQTKPISASSPARSTLLSGPHQAAGYGQRVAQLLHAGAHGGERRLGVVLTLHPGIRTDLVNESFPSRDFGTESGLRVHRGESGARRDKQPSGHTLRSNAMARPNGAALHLRALRGGPAFEAASARVRPTDNPPTRVNRPFSLPAVHSSP